MEEDLGEIGERVKSLIGGGGESVLECGKTLHFLRLVIEEESLCLNGTSFVKWEDIFHDPKPLGDITLEQANDFIRVFLLHEILEFLLRGSPKDHYLLIHSHASCLQQIPFTIPLTLHISEIKYWLQGEIYTDAINLCKLWITTRINWERENQIKWEDILCPSFPLIESPQLAKGNGDMAVFSDSHEEDYVERFLNYLKGIYPHLEVMYDFGLTHKFHILSQFLEDTQKTLLLIPYRENQQWILIHITKKTLSKYNGVILFARIFSSCAHTTFWTTIRDKLNLLLSEIITPKVLDLIVSNVFNRQIQKSENASKIYVLYFAEKLVEDTLTWEGAFKLDIGTYSNHILGILS